jgi:RNA polymerase sigma-70 factor (ECF subfamily)
MKRASAESASLGSDSGLATGRAEHTGLRLEDAALLSNHRLDAPAAIEPLFDRYHEEVYDLAMSILMNRNDAEEAMQDRLVVALSDLQAFSFEDTAQVLGLSIAAVKLRLHLARLYLRERLSRYHRNGRVV